MHASTPAPHPNVAVPRRVVVKGTSAAGNSDTRRGERVPPAADVIVCPAPPLRVTLPRLWRRTLHRIRNNVELWGGNRETWRDQFASRHSIFVWTIISH